MKSGEERTIVSKSEILGITMVTTRETKKSGGRWIVEDGTWNKEQRAGDSWLST